MQNSSMNLDHRFSTEQETPFSQLSVRLEVRSQGRVLCVDSEGATGRGTCCPDRMGVAALTRAELPRTVENQCLPSTLLWVHGLHFSKNCRPLSFPTSLLEDTLDDLEVSFTAFSPSSEFCNNSAVKDDTVCSLDLNESLIFPRGFPLLQTCGKTALCELLDDASYFGATQLFRSFQKPSDLSRTLFRDLPPGQALAVLEACSFF